MIYYAVSDTGTLGKKEIRVLLSDSEFTMPAISALIKPKFLTISVAVSSVQGVMDVLLCPNTQKVVQDSVANKIHPSSEKMVHSLS